jgi:hypothetical protein
MRGDAAALDSCDASAALRARSSVRSAFRRSSRTLRRRTVTFSATTPASRIPTTAIQASPAATPRRCRLRGRAAGLGFGRGRGRDRRTTGGVAGAASVQEATAQPSSALTAARSRADEARGFAAVSAGVGLIAFRVSALNTGCLPQTQTGKSGGHTQPFSCAFR